jgi:cell pole-organizing protein PopZ
MSNQGPAQEPTMEEILASIRRIISEDSGAQDAPAEDYEPALPAYDDEEPPRPQAIQQDDEVMELTEALPEQEPRYEEQVPAYRTEPSIAEPVYRQPAYEPEPAYQPEPVYEPEPAPEPQYAAPDYPAHDQDIAYEEPAMTTHSPAPKLLSSESEQAAAASFGKLANSMLSSSGSGRTLEEVVGDQLRPMLKQWLDENLPGLVERLVREEIERVSRRGR